MNISTSQFNLAASDGKIYLRIKDGSQVVISTNQKREVVVTPVKNPEADKPKVEAPVAEKVIAPKVGYKMLKHGEIIKKGDYLLISGSWEKAVGMIGDEVGRYNVEACRKIPNYPKLFIGYSLLSRGATIQEGDYVATKNYLKWQPAAGLIGEKLGDQGKSKWYACRKNA